MRPRMQKGIPPLGNRKRFRMILLLLKWSRRLVILKAVGENYRDRGHYFLVRRSKVHAASFTFATTVTVKGFCEWLENTKIARLGLEMTNEIIFALLLLLIIPTNITVDCNTIVYNGSEGLNWIRNVTAYCSNQWSATIANRIRISWYLFLTHLEIKYASSVSNRYSKE